MRWMVLALLVASPSSAQLVDNPDAPVGVVGFTPYFDLADMTGRAGLRVTAPATHRITIHLDIRRRWFSDDWTAPSSYSAGHPGWRDDDDDGDIIIIVPEHEHPPPQVVVSTNGTPAWQRPDDQWIVGGAVTFWLGSPQWDPHVIPWKDVEGE